MPGGVIIISVTPEVGALSPEGAVRGKTSEKFVAECKVVALVFITDKIARFVAIRACGNFSKLDINRGLSLVSLDFDKRVGCTRCCHQSHARNPNATSANAQYLQPARFPRGPSREYFLYRRTVELSHTAGLSPKRFT